MSVPQIGLQQAAQQIKVSVTHACEAGEAQSPFLVITGAGVSYPPVPLATGIMERCRAECARLSVPPPEPTGNPLTDYAELFRAAYPGPEDRRRYIETIAADPPINLAGLRLGHLLLDPGCRLTNLVVTTNFDDILERALRLLGAEPSYSDHPLTAARVDPLRANPGIVHVHGSYWFYDCCNLQEEIADRAGAASGIPADLRYSTVGEYLDGVLAQRSPVVVGYAGWEGDVVMGALRRRLSRAGGLSANLYWFSYCPEDVAALPSWLKGHPNVYVVSPPDPSSRSEGSQEGGALSAATDSAKPALSATDVFEALIQALGCPPLRLFEAPLEVFRAQLRRALPEDGDTGSYNIAEVIADLERAEQLLRADRAASPPPPVERALAEVRTAVRQADYAGAVRAAQGQPLTAFSQPQLTELFGLLDEACPPSWEGDDPDADAFLARVACALLDTEAASGRLEDRARERTARALARRAARLDRLGRHEDAILACDEVVTRYGDDTSPALREQVARTLFSKGNRLGALGRSEDAILVYDEVATRYANDPSLALREQVAKALVNKGPGLGQLNRHEGEVAVCDEVITRYGDDPSPALRELTSAALINKGIALGALGRSEDAILVYDEVATRYGEDPSPALRELAARALFGRAYALGELSRSDDAIVAYDEVATRYGDDPSPAVREHVARALVNKGSRLGQLSRYEDAILVYDEVVTRYGDDSSPALRTPLATALRNQGVALGQLGRSEDALLAYNEVIARYGDDPSPALREQVAEALAATARATKA
jgi:tetratricopeptide (TPR) repeat protein